MLRNGCCKNRLEKLRPQTLLPSTLLIVLLKFCQGDECAPTRLQPRDLTVLDLQCSSSWHLGAAVGQATRSLIQERYAASEGLQRCIQYAGTPEGQYMVDHMLQLHSKQYPQYINELRGLAAGADVPFSHVLLANMRQELLSAAQPDSAPPEDSCTDVMLSINQQDPADAETGSLAQDQQQQRKGKLTLLGHNEDMTRDTEGRVYFVRFTNTSSHSKTHTRGQTTSPARHLLATSNSPVKQRLLHSASQHQPFTWLGFVYAGELASSGFGFNTAGIGFTLNAVFPSEARMPGICRNFVSRQLLKARSISEALKIIGRPNQAVGHSYNLFDLHSKRMFNIEVGPGSAMSVIEVGSLGSTHSWYFHANSFKHLVVQQQLDNSSYHREVRALQLQAPCNADELLAILGDTADPDYPIYRHGKSQADSDVITLCTALVDLERAVLEVYTGNPATNSGRTLQLRFDLHTLQLLPLDES